MGGFMTKLGGTYQYLKPLQEQNDFPERVRKSIEEEIQKNIFAVCRRFTSDNYDKRGDKKYDCKQDDNRFKQNRD
jgi:hypothetical protein